MSIFSLLLVNKIKEDYVKSHQRKLGNIAGKCRLEIFFQVFFIVPRKKPQKFQN